MRVVLLGNCQVPILAEALRLATPGIEITRALEIYRLAPGQAPEAERATEAAETQRAIEAADLILTQRIMPVAATRYDLPLLATQTLRALRPDRVVVFPTLNFTGFTPDVRHLRRDNGPILAGPLGNYHYDRVLSAYRQGVPATEATRLLDGETLLDAMPDPFAVALEQLRMREVAVDVTISDLVADITTRHRHFHTPGHPSNLLLLHMAMRIAARAGLPFDAGAAGGVKTALHDIDLPGYPAILRHYGLPPEPRPTFRGTQVVDASPRGVKHQGVVLYEPLPLVEAFYRVYDAVGPLPGPSWPPVPPRRQPPR
ncbi:hypothetical protein GXW78_17265 [Roseomonas terrae]|uniref:Polysaccharide biosynthesis enzyme WcbI domain-containing protein n=1 Tax=Neoroseomonas terrae TaxID=424799 RepID=A0ABS5EK66_9PROT|nr:WcbI family polysaccharide biosynthesis putative acetyltransferase [Neoroseomonas terrae]MBR0651423.1 hypothetical protein [Neoroseomonas terrae]